MAAFRQCMQQHGATMPSHAPGQRPGGGSPGAQPSGRPSMSSQQQQAVKACASLRPKGAGGFGGGQQGGGN
jgi:hypothetical protein